MPGKSFQGKTKHLEKMEADVAMKLKLHVKSLCGNSGGRNYIEKESLDLAKDYIIGQFHSYKYKIIQQEYEISNETYSNIGVELSGKDKPEEIFIIGAHYDSVIRSPGANDNGSGIAALLELARVFKDKNFSRTIRFVAFVNEEPPHYHTNNMGSFVYANECALKKEKIIGMLSLETIGYYRDEIGSQKYPFPFSLFYPKKGNFIAFVGNISSRSFVRETIQVFRQHAVIPSEGIAAPSFIPGISWSDQWSFWLNNYPGIMITDTAPFRYPYYHSTQDTPDKINYEKMVHVIEGLKKVLEHFANK